MWNDEDGDTSQEPEEEDYTITPCGPLGSRTCWPGKATRTGG